MKIQMTGNKTVDSLYGIDFTGNIIPSAWYDAIRTESGKPYTIAISILAEIVYWYRPSEERDENNLDVIKLRKKFRSDILQINYKQLNTKFGFTKDQSRRAVIALEKMGLIKRQPRTIETKGEKLGNVMFIELNVDKLIEITYPQEELTPIMKNPNRVCEKSEEVFAKKRNTSLQKSEDKYKEYYKK